MDCYMASLPAGNTFTTTLLPLDGEPVSIAPPGLGGELMPVLGEGPTDSLSHFPAASIIQLGPADGSIVDGQIGSNPGSYNSAGYLDRFSPQQHGAGPAQAELGSVASPPATTTTAVTAPLPTLSQMQSEVSGADVSALLPQSETDGNSTSKRKNNSSFTSTDAQSHGGVRRQRSWTTAPDWGVAMKSHEDDSRMASSAVPGTTSALPALVESSSVFPTDHGETKQEKPRQHQRSWPHPLPGAILSLGEPVLEEMEFLSNTVSAVPTQRPKPATFAFDKARVEREIAVAQPLLGRQPLSPQPSSSLYNTSTLLSQRDVAPGGVGPYQNQSFLFVYPDAMMEPVSGLGMTGSPSSILSPTSMASRRRQQQQFLTMAMGGHRGVPDSAESSQGNANMDVVIQASAMHSLTQYSPPHSPMVGAGGSNSTGANTSSSTSGNTAHNHTGLQSLTKSGFKVRERPPPIPSSVLHRSSGVPALVSSNTLKTGLGVATTPQKTSASHAYSSLSGGSGSYTGVESTINDKQPVLSDETMAHRATEDDSASPFRNVSTAPRRSRVSISSFPVPGDLPEGVRGLIVLPSTVEPEKRVWRGSGIASELEQPLPLELERNTMNVTPPQLTPLTDTEEQPTFLQAVMRQNSASNTPPGGGEHSAVLDTNTALLRQQQELLEEQKRLLALQQRQQETLKRQHAAVERKNRKKLERQAKRAAKAHSQSTHPPSGSPPTSSRSPDEQESPSPVLHNSVSPYGALLLQQHLLQQQRLQQPMLVAQQQDYLLHQQLQLQQHMRMQQMQMELQALQLHHSATSSAADAPLPPSTEKRITSSSSSKEKKHKSSKQHHHLPRSPPISSTSSSRSTISSEWTSSPSALARDRAFEQLNREAEHARRKQKEQRERPHPTAQRHPETTKLSERLCAVEKEVEAAQRYRLAAEAREREREEEVLRLSLEAKELLRQELEEQRHRHEREEWRAGRVDQLRQQIKEPELSYKRELDQWKRNEAAVEPELLGDPPRSYTAAKEAEEAFYRQELEAWKGKVAQLKRQLEEREKREQRTPPSSSSHPTSHNVHLFDEDEEEEESKSLALRRRQTIPPKGPSSVLLEKISGVNLSCDVPLSDDFPVHNVQNLKDMKNSSVVLLPALISVSSEPTSSLHHLVTDPTLTSSPAPATHKTHIHYHIYKKDDGKAELNGERSTNPEQGTIHSATATRNSNTNAVKKHIIEPSAVTRPDHFKKGENSAFGSPIALNHRTSVPPLGGIAVSHRLGSSSDRYLEQEASSPPPPFQDTASLKLRLQDSTTDSDLVLGPATPNMSIPIAPPQQQEQPQHALPLTSKPVYHTGKLSSARPSPRVPMPLGSGWHFEVQQPDEVYRFPPGTNGFLEGSNQQGMQYEDTDDVKGVLNGGGIGRYPPGSSSERTPAPQSGFSGLSYQPRSQSGLLEDSISSSSCEISLDLGRRVVQSFQEARPPLRGMESGGGRMPAQLAGDPNLNLSKPPVWIFPDMEFIIDEGEEEVTYGSSPSERLAPRLTPIQPRQTTAPETRQLPQQPNPPVKWTRPRRPKNVAAPESTPQGTGKSVLTISQPAAQPFTECSSSGESDEVSKLIQSSSKTNPFHEEGEKKRDEPSQPSVIKVQLGSLSVNVPISLQQKPPSTKKHLSNRKENQKSSRKKTTSKKLKPPLESGKLAAMSTVPKGTDIVVKIPSSSISSSQATSEPSPSSSSDEERNLLQVLPSVCSGGLPHSKKRKKNKMKAPHYGVIPLPTYPAVLTPPAFADSSPALPATSMPPSATSALLPTVTPPLPPTPAPAPRVRPPSRDVISPTALEEMEERLRRYTDELRDSMTIQLSDLLQHLREELKEHEREQQRREKLARRGGKGRTPLVRSLTPSPEVSAPPVTEAVNPPVLPPSSPPPAVSLSPPEPLPHAPSPAATEAVLPTAAPPVSLAVQIPAHPPPAPVPSPPFLLAPPAISSPVDVIQTIEPPSFPDSYSGGSDSGGKDTPLLREALHQIQCQLGALQETNVQQIQDARDEMLADVHRMEQVYADRLKEIAERYTATAPTPPPQPFSPPLSPVQSAPAVSERAAPESGPDASAALAAELQRKEQYISQTFNTMIEQREKVLRLVEDLWQGELQAAKGARGESPTAAPTQSVLYRHQPAASARVQDAKECPPTLNHQATRQVQSKPFASFSSVHSNHSAHSEAKKEELAVVESYVHEKEDLLKQLQDHTERGAIERERISVSAGLPSLHAERSPPTSELPISSRKKKSLRRKTSGKRGSSPATSSSRRRAKQSKRRSRSPSSRAPRRRGNSSRRSRSGSSSARRFVIVSPRHPPPPQRSARTRRPRRSGSGSGSRRSSSGSPTRRRRGNQLVKEHLQLQAQKEAEERRLELMAMETSARLQTEQLERQFREAQERKAARRKAKAEAKATSRQRRDAHQKAKQHREKRAAEEEARAMVQEQLDRQAAADVAAKLKLAEKRRAVAASKFAREEASMHAEMERLQERLRSEQRRRDDIFGGLQRQKREIEVAQQQQLMELERLIQREKRLAVERDERGKAETEKETRQRQREKAEKELQLQELRSAVEETRMEVLQLQEQRHEAEQQAEEQLMALQKDGEGRLAASRQTLEEMEQHINALKQREVDQKAVAQREVHRLAQLRQHQAEEVRAVVRLAKETAEELAYRHEWEGSLETEPSQEEFVTDGEAGGSSEDGAHTTQHRIQLQQEQHRRHVQLLEEEAAQKQATHAEALHQMATAVTDLRRQVQQSRHRAPALERQTARQMEQLRLYHEHSVMDLMTQFESQKRKMHAIEVAMEQQAENETMEQKLLKQRRTHKIQTVQAEFARLQGRMASHKKFLFESQAKRRQQRHHRRRILQNATEEEEDFESGSSESSGGAAPQEAPHRPNSQRSSSRSSESVSGLLAAPPMIPGTARGPEDFATATSPLQPSSETYQLLEQDLSQLQLDAMALETMLTELEGESITGSSSVSAD